MKFSPGLSKLAGAKAAHLCNSLRRLETRKRQRNQVVESIARNLSAGNPCRAKTALSFVIPSAAERSAVRLNPKQKPHE